MIVDTRRDRREDGPSSILGEHPASRLLTAAIVGRLFEGTPDAVITYRDLARKSLPQFSAALANVAGVPVEQRSDELRRDAQDLAAVLDELLAADVIVKGWLGVELPLA